MDYIARYVDHVLRPSLAPLRLRTDQEAIVVDDIAHRLQSLFANWHNTALRMPLLELTRELAAFYTPTDAPCAVRQIVATAVRNSVLEDVGAMYPVDARLSSPSSQELDTHMPTITGTAIRFWAAQPFRDVLSAHTTVPSIDPFAALPKRYPRAWHILHTLAMLQTPSRAVQMPRAQVPILPAPVTIGNPGSGKIMTESGFNPHFLPALYADLVGMRDTPGRVFFVDSFKELSRLPDKVCHVLEWVIAQQCSFVTTNYYITPQIVARRTRVLRPSHYSDDTLIKLQQPHTDTIAPHREFLHAYAIDYARLLWEEDERRARQRDHQALTQQLVTRR